VKRALGLFAVACVVLAAATSGYLVASGDRGSRQEAKSARQDAFAAALKAASESASERASERGQADGLKAGRERGNTVGQRKGRSVGSADASAQAEELAANQYQDEAAAAAAAATSSDPASIPTAPDGSCPPGYSYSMGTCTTYDPYSCGPGEIRVHATLECIRVP
jgi:hypothetical protein